MRSRSAGVQPLSGRGLIFLLGFVSFLLLALIGPHIHGSETAPTPVSSASRMLADPGQPGADSATEGAPGADAAASAAASFDPAIHPATAPEPGDGIIGVAAACVLVLLLVLAYFATRAAPERAQARVSEQPRVPLLVDEPRGTPLPLFLLLSISRT